MIPKKFDETYDKTKKKELKPKDEPMQDTTFEIIGEEAKVSSETNE